jgi:hypothetical protein
VSSTPPVTGRPAGRYGDSPRPRRRLALLAALVTLGSVLLGMLVWSAWHFATPDVRAGLLGFTVVDDSRVDVRFEVVADPAATVECDLRAQNLARDTVGSARVPVGPSAEGRRVLTATVRTRERAVSGQLEECRLV